MKLRRIKHSVQVRIWFKSIDVLAIMRRVKKRFKEGL